MATKKDTTKQGFITYHEDILLLQEAMTYEQLGRLLVAINYYSMTGDKPELDADIAGVFALISAKIRKQEEQYADTVAKRKKAAEARWGDDANASDDMQTDANESKDMHMHANASKIDAKGCTCIPVHQKSMQTMQTETETETVLYPLLQNNNNNYTCAREDDPFAVDNEDNAEAQLDRMQEELGCSPPDREVLRRLCVQYPPDQVIRAVTYAKKDGAKATVLDVARILRVWKRKDEVDDAFDWAVQGGS